MKGEYRDLILKGNISQEQWYHIAVTLKDLDTNGPSGRLYIDGNFTDIDEIENDLSRNYTTHMLMGNSGGKGHPDFGKIDELRIYDDFLTESQVNALFEEGVACRAEKECGKIESVNYCWNNFFCTNTTTPICASSGKNSRCEISEKTFCAPCEHGCQNANCVVEENQAKLENNAEINPNQTIVKPSFFKKVKCRLFTLLNSQRYIICLQAS